MHRKLHILIVDDDLQIQELLKDYLQQHGYRVSTAANEQEMVKILDKAKIDLIVLDIMLPGNDGLTLCRQLREKSDVLIIFLSAVGDETDRIVGLEVGADDYITKPFSPRELLARIKALLRRTTGVLAEQRKKNQLSQMPDIHFQEWSLNRNTRHLIAPDGITIPLSDGEYRLLLVFLENPQRVLSRDQLLDLTKGREAEPYDRSIDVQVGRLRKKIEIDIKNPLIIQTVRGGGYQFAGDVKQGE